MPHHALHSGGQEQVLVAREHQAEAALALKGCQDQLIAAGGHPSESGQVQG